ncbi:uncharacterized protein LOC106758252 [Vigna radiata var. radiata]|uniref:Uncharacterized protein LOC106758252 n=1 Tax=Vigna radiata var. radiata TaxID=3916 RepID=A0A1S3TSH5_VIGRR|nr:uncharacterized protein LOC106758252 [Vigna radiata var. radiata]
MSGQQKGLMQVIQEVVPRVDQRFCVRHLCANFRKKFPGKQLKCLMWKATSATHPQAWELEMRNINQLNNEAFKYLLKIPPRHWSRSRFSTIPQCDTLVNMSEAFNSVLVHTRSKPIISMLEDIRLYLMKRWARSGLSVAYHVATFGCYEIPKSTPEDFIPCCFRKTTYEETYCSIVYPINGKNMWEITPYVDVLPPPKRILPGRPKKKRRLEQWELVNDDKRMRKGGIKKRCGKCKQLGHNRTSCTQSTEPMMSSTIEDEVAL